MCILMPAYPSFVHETLHHVQSADYTLVHKLISHINQEMEDDNGGILVFLPGMPEIKQLYNILDSEKVQGKHKLKVLPLHSSLTSGTIHFGILSSHQRNSKRFSKSRRSACASASWQPTLLRLCGLSYFSFVLPMLNSSP